MMDYRKKYIDSVEGNAHNSAVEIIEQLEAENKQLRDDIELRKDYESYLQSTKDPMHSYVGWKLYRKKRRQENPK